MPGESFQLWRTTLARVQERFQRLVNQGVRVGLLLIEQSDNSSAIATACDEVISMVCRRHGHGARRVTWNHVPYPSTLQRRDVDTVGRRFTVDLGTIRHFYHISNVTPTTEVYETAGAAGRCISGLPREVAVVLKIGAESLAISGDQERWYCVVFDLAWRKFRGSPLVADRRFYYQGASYVVDHLESFRTQLGIDLPVPPPYFYSFLDDCIKSSVDAIDVLLSSEADGPKRERPQTQDREPPDRDLEAAPGRSETVDSPPPPPVKFTGGNMVFFEDRVELCGVDICSGKRSRKKRQALDLLRKQKGNGTFIAYSGAELAEKIGFRGGQDAVAGMIRDLRAAISKRLLAKANIECGRHDVILSGEAGYCLKSCISISVQSAEAASAEETHGHDQGHDRDAEGPGDGDDGEPNDGDDRDLTDRNDGDDGENDGDDRDMDARNDPDGRRRWILDQIAKGRKLRTAQVIDRFGCSQKTAERDFTALRQDGLVKFVGAANTGHYELIGGPPSG